jgi:hypothetical protein
MAISFRSREEALQKLRTLWVMFLITIGLYAYAGELTPGFRWLRFAYAFEVFSALAILNILYIVLMRRKLFPASQSLASQPDDPRAIRRWYGSQVILLASAECLPLFGLALRLGGETLNQALPFYVAGGLLLLLLWPRQIPTQARFSNPGT